MNAAVKQPPVRVKRHRRRWYAAPLGFAILLLAVIGLVSLIVLAVRGIQSSRNTDELCQQVYGFTYPLAIQNPSAFSDPANEHQDALMLAAIWRVTNNEVIRQKQLPDSPARYEKDDLGRWVIPISEISVAYSELFGAQAIPYCHTIGEAGTAGAYEYSLTRSCYYVPASNASHSAYTPVVDTVRRSGDTITARIGYVRNDQLTYDPAGQAIPPSADLATYTQTYTITISGDRWTITAVADK